MSDTVSENLKDCGVLAKFPKVRPDLSPAYRAILREQYFRSRHGLSMASRMSLRMERWMHRWGAADSFETGATLEIGPGTLNHLPFEPETSPYDIVEPFSDLYATSPYRDRVRSAYADIRDVPHNVAYRRILAIATFEHVLDLPVVVARCGLLLAPGGQLRVGIPSEGGPLWALACRLTTGWAFRRRYGLDYATYMRYEHVNTAEEVQRVLRCFFDGVEGHWLGISPRWSLYQFYQCSWPNLDKCLAYWENHTTSRIG